MKTDSSILLDRPRILSVKEVSKVLYIGKSKVYSMLEEGELKGFKIGKLWRVCSNDIECYIKEHYSVCG